MKATWTFMLSGLGVLLIGCAGGPSDPSGDGSAPPVDAPRSDTPPPGEGGSGAEPVFDPNGDGDTSDLRDPDDSGSDGTGGSTTSGPESSTGGNSDPGVDPGSGGGSICEAGIENSAQSVCCPSSCGSCGGPGCSTFPGGAESCCAGPIEDSQKYCDKSAPPCIVGSTPDVVPPEPPVGEVLWYGDPNLPLRTVFYRFDTHGNTNPTGNQCVDNPDTPPVASTPTNGTYGKHWRIHKPTSRKRAEFARTNGLVPKEGDDWYVGWRWRVTSPGTISNGMAVFQWKSAAGNDTWKDTQNYPFTMGYNGKELTLTAHGSGYPDWTEGSSITNRATTIWRHAVNQGEWVTILFRVKVSRDPSIGFIEFWFNGEKQTLMNSNYKEYQVVLANNDTRAYHKTLDSTEVYMKWGSYGQGACTMDITVDFDEMRVATSYGLVADPLAQ